ncbi:hypothetical protein ACIA74_33895 [Streptomyces sp. NPDC051658]|nr:hypothetical protein [Streptomyces sp. NBC_01363]MCX4735869.1 hypothetical protein [Streptomyces sp. NBC_01363]WSX26841.1 hypothetical protein OG520_06790 [Streptomyces sp. NBC_00984]
MTFVADDAALATGDGGFSGDVIGCEQQLGKPAAESDGWKAPAEDDRV